eukprot:7181517-Pyramimonas_sp.AAC.1
MSIRWAPPAAIKHGDSFADRSPTGMARSSLNLRSTSSRWTPSSLRKQRQFDRSHPHRGGGVEFEFA